MRDVWSLPDDGRFIVKLLDAKSKYYGLGMDDF